MNRKDRIERCTTEYVAANAEFLAAKERLLLAARELYPQGSVVLVMGINQGIVHSVNLVDRRQINILFENGNIWEKFFRDLVPVARRDWHPWIRRSKRKR